MRAGKTYGCLQYSKSTIFQANHNVLWQFQRLIIVVCNTAKVRFFKQITTYPTAFCREVCCLQYSKSTIFQANHNRAYAERGALQVVCNTAKVRFFKQITTLQYVFAYCDGLFAILQKYDFSSKSQPSSNSQI